MARTFSLAHLTLPGCPLDVFIETAARAGYDHVSLRMTKVSEDDCVYPLISDRSLRRRTGRLISDAGLSVLDVELLRLDRETEPEQFEPLLEASAELGARTVIVQIPDPDRQRAVDRYSRLCDLARSYRLGAALEFVSWTETADLRAAAAIVRAAGRTNGGILVDMLHFDRSGSELEDLEKIPAAWFQFIHLCDAPRATPALTAGVIQAARSARLFPGEGELPIREVLRRIPAVPCSLEIPNAELLDKLGPDEFARRALASARRYLAAEPDQETAGVLPAGFPRTKTPDARTRETRGDGTWHDR
ncbi:MAG: sugar phosphate isomerase/epimerase [Desulfofustis sp.]|nr:sugar phosphate isomerase/epimerase [Desulfofustis sp.]